MKIELSFLRVNLLLILLFVITSLPSAQQKRAITFQDIMKFKSIENPVISEFGKFVAYTSKPDRGNSAAEIKSTVTNTVFKIDRGSKPQFSSDEKWAAVILNPDFAELEKKGKNKDKPQNGLVILNCTNGDTLNILDVDKYQFSPNSKWIAYLHYKPLLKDSCKTNEKQKKGKNENSVGSTLVLKNLETDNETAIPFVTSFGFDSLSNYLAYSIADTSGRQNGLFLKSLSNNDKEPIIIDTSFNSNYTGLLWHKSGKLIYLKSYFKDKDNSDSASLYLWDKKALLLTSSIDAPNGWMIPSQNNLYWTKDGNRIFFGYKPVLNSKKRNKSNDTLASKDIYNEENILSKKEVDVWHWNDPLIKPNERKKWKAVKKQTYPAVYHFSEHKVVPLTNLSLPYIKYSNNPENILAYSNVPYLKEITWEGFYYDVYIININSGLREKIANKIENNFQLSPNGKFAVYYNNKNWFLYNIKDNSTINLTKDLAVPFYDTEDDHPSPPPGFGVAGWTDNDNAVIIYNKYDIWKFLTSNGKAINITNSGIDKQMTFRIVKTDPDAEFFHENEKLLLTAYHNKEKYTAFYNAEIDRQGTIKLLQGNYKLKFISKAKQGNKYIFTRESYTEFPDLWIGNSSFDKITKLTSFNTQTDSFYWGSAELIEWLSLDGIPLQGVLIKPDNFKADKKYPVIVYYYELFSQRLYEFSDMSINHRPNFPFYTSNGYAIFLPDIKFEVGRPGFSATKCVIPGVQKLIDLGIADPKGIGLHGHSWSGYETAFVITQSNIFSCAIAGAPVANMTSAYSGIRWGTGLARQFQYEKQQSRIGGSLWQKRDAYIENSPVFYADKIKTPLLIEHGDDDDAVPWYQSVEMYLAMRRLGKDCIFLQYRGEPHHLKKYPNKLDYSIKMKEYFDHYLKKISAADWIVNGVKFDGN